MSEPVAYLLTWTCYGTWLPGDERGCVDTRHHTPGDAYARANDWREKCNARRLKHAPTRLGAEHRRIVHQAIVDHCAVRRWTLHALNVRTNHVHVVLSCPHAPDVARDQFKSWATRRLREAGFFSKPTIVWTEDGSSRYLWSTGELQSAVRYVTDGQGPDLD